MKEMIKILSAIIVMLIMLIVLSISTDNEKYIKYEELKNKIEYINLLNESNTLELAFKIYKKERNKSAFDTDLLTTINDEKNKDGLEDLNYIDFKYVSVSKNSTKLVNDKEKVYFIKYSYSNNINKKIDITTCTYIENTKDRKYPQKIKTKNFNDIQGFEISIALGENKYACFEHPEGSKLKENESRYVFIYKIE